MTESAFWNSDWAEAQRKYWENWTEMSRKAMGLEVAPKSPWESGMDHWWQAVSPMAPDATRGFMEKMLHQSKAFFRMAEEYTRDLPGIDKGGDWMAGMNKMLEQMRGAFSGSMPGMDNESVHKIMAFWELPLDNWQRMVSSLSMVPGDMLKNMPHGGMQASLEQFLSAPGLGYTREEQGQQQKMMRLVMDYNKALQAYSQFFSNLGLQSVERFKDKLTAIAEKGDVVSSGRALYDLWVGASEEVYGEQVMTPEYAKVHGQLVNALMAVKKQAGTMVDEFLGLMNMPTRGELRTLQDRSQELRRENKALRAEINDIKEKLDAMGSKVPAKAAPAATRAPAASKAAPKKKVAAKKSSK